MEEILMQCTAKNKANLQSQAATLRTLETQLGQLANAITDRPQGASPSNTEVNLRKDGKKHYNAITLRSGKELLKPIEKYT
ncbi:hypothetical protein PanWU01x14_071400 [Parasponia andersonii]|uniref:Uncharacterized protein n=1 Tax=Parasponia andersonii TaxID=3476 RepID=A0A2P5DEF7_PARAD|nr:hypothetical protein PanWU01x14_071400 [Parasponia andersonii]